MTYFVRFFCLELDSQEHLLVCLRLKQYLGDDQKLLLLGVKYEHLFGTPEEQLNAVRMFQVLLKIRHRLLDDDQRPAYHGNSSGPSYFYIFCLLVIWKYTHTVHPVSESRGGVP